jgi:LEA14-like dessication related protein
MRKLFLAAIPILLMMSCAAPKAPEFVAVEDVYMTNKQHDYIEFKGDVVMHNPNNITVNLNNLKLDILVNGIHVSSVNQIMTTTIGAKSNFRVPVSASFELQDLVKNKGNFLQEISKIFKEKKVDVLYKGEAALEVKGIKFTVPIDYTSEMPIK